MNNDDCEVLICKKSTEGVEVKKMKDRIEKDYKFLKNHLNSQAVANFLAFGEYSTDLHNLLYGLLEEKDDKEFKNDCLIWYKQNKNGEYIKEEGKSLHYIIRNLIHHPENKNENNLAHKSYDNLKRSIDDMILEVSKEIITQNSNETATKDGIS